MKIKFLLLFVCCLVLESVACFSQSHYAYNVEKVINDVFVLKPVINKYRWVTANIVVIVNDTDVFVVDSGLLPAAAEEAIKEIKKITDKPVRYLVNTHWHGDHWQGNGAFLKAFPNIEIIATAQGLKGMSRNGMVWAHQYYAKYFENYVTNYEEAISTQIFEDQPLDAAELEELKTGLVEMKQDLESIKKLEPVLPNVTYSDEMVINQGGREIRLLYLGIGNTSGDAVIYLPQQKVLISGDLVVYPSPYESGMFSPEWLETMKKLAKIDYNYLIPGHGDVQKDHLYLNYLNALFAEIIKQVSEAYVHGTTHVENLREEVTYETVTNQLVKLNPAYSEFSKNLEPSFVPAAIQTSYKRIIQGKQ